MTNGREESNGPRQNVAAKHSKTKVNEEIANASLLKADKKSRKIIKNKEKEVKMTVTKKLNRRPSTNDKKQVMTKRDQTDKKVATEKIRKILHDSKEL